MESQFKKGERVRYSSVGKDGLSHRWHDRKGTVLTNSKDPERVTVRWDGSKWHGCRYHIRFIERDTPDWGLLCQEVSEQFKKTLAYLGQND